MHQENLNPTSMEIFGKGEDQSLSSLMQVKMIQSFPGDDVCGLIIKYIKLAPAIAQRHQRLLAEYQQVQMAQK